MSLRILEQKYKEDILKSIIFVNDLYCLVLSCIVKEKLGHLPTDATDPQPSIKSEHGIFDNAKNTNKICQN